MKTESNINNDPKPDKPFINIKGDYGFKWFFGRPERKHVLIRFLNAVFQRAGRDIVVDKVVYRDKEILPTSDNGKKIIYDIYCTTPEEEHHFVVEMQKEYTAMLEERFLYYTSKLVAEQGKAGWLYDLKPVFTIVICDFDMYGLPKQLFHDIVLYDKETKVVYSEKFNILFICLKELPDSWNKCITEFERLCWLIDRMGTLDRDSQEYNDMGYTDFIDAARKSGMSSEEYQAYSQSELALLENRISREKEKVIIRDNALAEGMAEGIAKGKAEGMAEGIAKGIAEGKAEGLFTKAIEVAKNLLRLNLDLSTIAESCGLNVDQVKSLAAQMK